MARVRAHPKDGKVIIVMDEPGRQMEVRLTPGQANMFASIILRHAARARSQEK